MTRKALLGRPTKLIVSALAILGLLGILLLLAPATVLSIFIGPPTTDMAPVCLKSSSIEGVKWLSIPKAYMPDASDRKSGDLGGLTLEFNYKDLTPWSLVPAGTEKYPARTPQDDVAKQDNYALLLLLDIKRVAEPYEPLNSPKYTPAPSPFPGWKRVNENDDLGTTLDYPDPMTNPKYQYVECTDYANHPRGTCTAVMPYRGLLLHFYFPSAHLQRMDSYVQRTHDLIDKFILAQPCSK